MNRAPLEYGQAQWGRRGPALLTALSSPAELGPPFSLEPQTLWDLSAGRAIVTVQGWALSCCHVPDLVRVHLPFRPLWQGQWGWFLLIDAIRVHRSTRLGQGRLYLDGPSSLFP